MTLPAILRGFLRRVRDRLVLIQHPNYHGLKRHLRSVWTGR